MEIIARPHVVFVCIVTLRGKRRNMAHVPAYWHIPAYLQTNSNNCLIKDLIQKRVENPDVLVHYIVLLPLFQTFSLMLLTI
jgi:hypothetical protein